MEWEPRGTSSRGSHASAACSLQSQRKGVPSPPPQGSGSEPAAWGGGLPGINHQSLVEHGGKRGLGAGKRQAFPDQAGCWSAKLGRREGGSWGAAHALPLGRGRGSLCCGLGGHRGVRSALTAGCCCSAPLGAAEGVVPERGSGTLRARTALKPGRQERGGFSTCCRLVSVIRGYIINVVLQGLEAPQQIPVSNK